MSTFNRELKKELRRHLTQGNGNEWSRRVEGALVRSEQLVPHEFVTIIIDGDMDENEYKLLSSQIFQFVKKDEFYRFSRYRILMWKNDELTLVSPAKISQMSRLKDKLGEIRPDGNNSESTWEKFWELYNPHKKAGQVILCTSAQRIESLRKSKVVGINNLVVLYCENNKEKIAEKIFNIPCIAYSVKSEEG